MSYCARIWQSYLADKAQISNLLRETRCRPAEIGRVLGIASELADSLTSAAPMAQNVADLLARVTVSHTSLNISIKRDRLLATLTDKFIEQSQDDGQDNIISLEATVPAVPGAGSSKFIFEDQNAKTPDAVVVKAIARAHRSGSNNSRQATLSRWRKLRFVKTSPTTMSAT